MLNKKCKKRNKKRRKKKKKRHEETNCLEFAKETYNTCILGVLHTMAFN
jgi:hypothetical protein